MTQYRARLLEVTEVRAGSEVVQAYAIGATSIVVYDSSAFNDTGGQLEAEDGTVYTYTAKDGDTDTITLAAPGLTTALAIDDAVWSYPASKEKEAMIQVDEEDAVTARVPHALYDALSAAVRNVVDYESVVAVNDGDEWVITDVIGQKISRDGSYVAPGTSTSQPVPTTAPATTPTLSVIGGVGSFYLSWGLVTDTFGATIDVHISEDNTAGTGFTPDSTTFLKTVDGTGATVTTEADGTPLMSTVDGTDTGARKTYYFKIVAHNSVGSAPASNGVASQLRQITGPDISVNAAWVGTMTADHLKGGDISASIFLTTGDDGEQEGGFIARGVNGEEVALKASGFKVKGATALGNPSYVDFPTSGAPNIISGVLKATTVEVFGDSTTGKAMSLFGQSELASGGEFRIASAVQAPLSQPVVVNDFDKITTNLTGVAYRYGGWYESSTNLLWFIEATVDLDKAGWLVSMNRSGVQQSRVAIPLPTGMPTTSNSYKAISLTRVGSTWYIGLRVTNLQGRGTGFYICQYTVSPLAFTSSRLIFQPTNTGSPDVLSYDGMNSMAIGTDGTYIYAVGWDAGTASSGNTPGMCLLRYPLAVNAAPLFAYLAKPAGGTVTPDNMTDDLRHILVGTFDVAAQTLILVTDSKMWTWAITTGGVVTANRNTDRDSGMSADYTGGLFWDSTDSRFWELGISRSKGLIPSLYKYAKNMWTTATGPTWWFNSTKFNAKASPRTVTGVVTTTGSNLVTAPAGSFVSSDTGAAISGTGIPAGATMTYLSSTQAQLSANATASGTVSATVTPIDWQTIPSPKASFTPFKRHFARVTVSYSGANGGRIYQGSGSSAPANTGMFLMATLTDPVLSALSEAVPTVTNPPTASTFPNNNPAQIISTDGGSYWKGDNTAKFLALVVDSSTDASALAGNTPALRVGNIAGNHLRIDGDEIISMTSDSAQGTLILNKGGQTNLARGGGKAVVGDLGRALTQIYADSASPTTNASGVATITHNLALGASPGYAVNITPRAGNPRFFSVTNKGANSFDITWWNSAGAVVASTSIPFDYEILAWT